MFMFFKELWPTVYQHGVIKSEPGSLCTLLIRRYSLYYFLIFFFFSVARFKKPRKIAKLTEEQMKAALRLIRNKYKIRTAAKINLLSYPTLRPKQEIWSALKILNLSLTIMLPKYLTKNKNKHPLNIWKTVTITFILSWTWIVGNWLTR